MSPLVQPFYDPTTSTVSYVVHAGAGSACAVIDPVLDFEARSGRTATTQADRILAFIAEDRLALAWIFETHVHADHLTAARLLKSRAGGRIAIGAGVVAVQETFGALFNAGSEFRRDGSEFDRLFTDGETCAIGDLTARILATPGHTPDGITYVIGDAAFVGDTMFMPDGGAFVALRTERDRKLPPPALLIPSVQVNMQAGNFPPAEANGVSYLKLPIDRL